MSSPEGGSKGPCVSTRRQSGDLGAAPPVVAGGASGSGRSAGETARPGGDFGLPAGDLDAETIRAELGGRRIGQRVLVYQTVGSTMDTLAELAEAGAVEGTVVLADQQTAGRGRLGRAWMAPPGAALTLSVLFRPPVDPDVVGQVPMVVGLGTVEALDPLLPDGVVAALKWPNDVLAGGRKVAGLLAEARLSAGRPGAVVVGLGLNVHQSAGDLVAGATSLADLGVRVERRSDLAAAILTAIDVWYGRLLAGRGLVDPWSRRLDTIGREVVATGVGREAADAEFGRAPVDVDTVRQAAGADAPHQVLDAEVGREVLEVGAGRVVRGRAIGVTPDGGLRIVTADGALVTVYAGDVTLAEDARPGH